jgi:hypothetical protein
MFSPWDCVREASVHVWLVRDVLDLAVILHHRHFFGSRSNSEFDQINTGAVPPNCSIKNLENIWGDTSGYIMYPSFQYKVKISPTSILGTFKLPLTAVRQEVNFFFSDPGFGFLFRTGNSSPAKNPPRNRDKMPTKSRPDPKFLPGPRFEG